MRLPPVLRPRPPPTSLTRRPACRATEASPPPPSPESRTCRRCKRRYVVADNHASACRFHPALYTGGEVSKAIGFVRRSADPGDWLGPTVGQTGLLRFYDCCGAEDEGAPGCEVGPHEPF